MRRDACCVNSECFYKWAKYFIEYVKDLTTGSRKLLLTFDGYPSHMSLKVMQLFYENGIVVYALHAHTSGRTQPCDVHLFGSSSGT